MPPGAAGGQQVQITTPSGQLLSATVPAGLVEGQTFQVSVAPTSAAMALDLAALYPEYAGRKLLRGSDFFRRSVQARLFPDYFPAGVNGTAEDHNAAVRIQARYRGNTVRYLRKNQRMIKEGELDESPPTMRKAATEKATFDSSEREAAKMRIRIPR